MDWLTRLPGIGPAFAWVLRTRVFRVYRHFSDAGSNRLAAAVSYYSFLALFPLLTVAMAAAAATLSNHQVLRLQEQIAEQLPGLAQRIDLEGLVKNAGTVGAVGGVILLFSGLGWVDTVRASVRTSWKLPPEPGNVILRKATDVLVLVGLGAVGLLSVAASVVFGAFAGQVARWLGIAHSTGGRISLTVVGVLIAIGVDALVFGYLMFGLPRVGDRDRRGAIQAALLGAAGFELLKQLLSAYLAGVAAKSQYGAFGTPVALLLWINFIARWLFYCVAWAATADEEADARRARARAAEAWEPYADEERQAAARAAARPLPPQPRPRTPTLLTGLALGAALTRAAAALRPRRD